MGLYYGLLLQSNGSRVVYSSTIQLLNVPHYVNYAMLCTKYACLLDKAHMQTKITTFGVL